MTNLYFVKFKLAGHWLCEPFAMPLEYIMGLNPFSVRDEMGKVVVWNYRLVRAKKATSTVTVPLSRVAQTSRI